MAIRIPILTSFDPKGLKQANAQFAKLQTSMGSLGRNFAVAGIAITAAFAAIGRSVADAADSQRVFAQTEAVLKSMGTTANGTAGDLANMASSLQKTTAFSDEAILAGANLLLTFKNIQNQAGEGNDIFDQTATLMLDVARAMGTSASGEAIRLGKALNDPVKGISALTRVGIQFTDQQKAQIKALAQSGDLMGAQKIILAELQQQFGGSAAAYAQTFTGQVESLNNELNDLSEEIGFMVMPAIKGMVAEFKNLIPVIGAQLKAAIESVDWKTLTTDVVNLATFFIKNATAIAQVTVAIFAINTAFKLMQVAMGIVNVALAVKAWWLAKVATGMTTAAIATGAFSTALKLIPFVAIATGFGLIIAGITETDSSYRTTTPVVTSFGQEILKTGHDAEWAAGKYGVLTDAMNGIPKNVKINVELETTSRNSALNSYLGFLGGRAAEATGGVSVPTITAPTASAGGAARQTSALGTLIADANKNARVTAKESALVNKGLSASVASWVTTSSKPIAAANQALKDLATRPKATVRKLTAAYNKSAAGQQAVAQAAQAAAESAAQAAAEMAAAQAAAAAAEAAALAERERVYQSFADSVKNTFAGIKNSIMGAFNLTELGGSTNAITRNMEKLLTRLRSFATNVKSLATMGLNPALLQQIISAGPIAGARLAEGLAMGGASGLSAINAGYAEFGALSGQIAETGTQSLFGTGAQQTVYNINVDGGVGSGSTIGKAIVDAIKAYERTSGAVWQGA
jgi:hypothetical protein